MSRQLVMVHATGTSLPKTDNGHIHGTYTDTLILNINGMIGIYTSPERLFLTIPWSLNLTGKMWILHYLNDWFEIIPSQLDITWRIASKHYYYPHLNLNINNPQTLDHIITGFYISQYQYCHNNLTSTIIQTPGLSYLIMTPSCLLNSKDISYPGLCTAGNYFISLRQKHTVTLIIQLPVLV